MKKDETDRKKPGKMMKKREKTNEKWWTRENKNKNTLWKREWLFSLFHHCSLFFLYFSYVFIVVSLFFIRFHCFFFSLFHHVSLFVLSFSSFFIVCFSLFHQFSLFFVLCFIIFQCLLSLFYHFSLFFSIFSSFFIVVSLVFIMFPCFFLSFSSCFIVFFTLFHHCFLFFSLLFIIVHCFFLSFSSCFLVFSGMLTWRPVAWKIISSFLHRHARNWQDRIFKGVFPYWNMLDSELLEIPQQNLFNIISQ